MDPRVHHRKVGPLRRWRFLASRLEGAPLHVHTRRRRGSACTQKAGMVDLGHRPASGARSQNGPVVLERRACARHTRSAGRTRPPGRVRALHPNPILRRPPRLGNGPIRGAHPARLLAKLPDLRAPDPHARAAAALRGMPRRQGSPDHRDRPSPRRGDPVGLVRATPGAMGWDGLCATWHPVALEPDPGCPCRIDRPDAAASRPSTGSCVVWVERHGSGGPTGWPR